MGKPRIEMGRMEALIGRLAPESVCDACLADRLSVPSLAEVQQRVHELAGMRGYERKTAACALCGTAQLTIRRKA